MRKQLFKTFFLLIIAVSFFCGAFAMADGINRGITVHYPTRPTDAQYAWMKKEFGIINSDMTFTTTADMAGFPGYIWSEYIDASSLVVMYGEYDRMVDFANSKGINSEDMLLHAKVDYTFPSATLWTGLDQFDRFENANGVLLETSPGVFADKSSNAYNGSVTMNSNMYIGYELPFDQANIVMKTPGVGVVGTWQYWNGDLSHNNGWADFATSHYTAHDGTTIVQNVFNDGTNKGDGTGSFTQSGEVGFYPPNDWQRTTINGSRNKYFIRFAYTSATTVPVINTIKGDPWYNDGVASHGRGWDASSPNIINVGLNNGELAYNTNPAVGASARFKYQSRFSTWGSNHFMFNIANTQVIDGVSQLSVAQYLAYATEKLHEIAAFNAIKFDDSIFNLSAATNGIAPTDTDSPITTTQQFYDTSKAQYASATADIHAILPGVLVGSNPYPYTTDFIHLGDWTVIETQDSTQSTGSANPRLSTPDVNNRMTYDDYFTPTASGNQMYGILIYADDSATTYAGNIYGQFAWDRANRGPIVALSKHLIGQNAGTYFCYRTNGGYYSEMDEVYLKNGTVLHQSVDPEPTIDQVDHWGPYFPAMDANVGVPDVNGWHGGARDMDWIDGTSPILNNAGPGITNSLWRRDYTNAIVLHRPSSSSGGTNTDYGTYSLDIPLGGTYYSLKADGTTGPAITSIKLRRSEGAILMKFPVGNDAIAPAAPSGLTVM